MGRGKYDEIYIDKFEQITHGTTNGVDVIPYKNPDGEDIVSDNTIKDLGVIVRAIIYIKFVFPAHCVISHSDA